MDFNHEIDLSIIIPVYKNCDTLAELHNQICSVLDAAGIHFEIIFVDDACPQNSIKELEKLTNLDKRVAVIALNQNKGQQNAILTGLVHAQGRLSTIMDADLQDPPAAIPKLISKLNKGYEVVFAGRKGKYQKKSRLLTSKLYKTILSFLTGVPADAGVFLVATRPAIIKILNVYAKNPHLVAMVGMAGLKTTSIPVRRLPRAHGESTYTSLMRLKVGGKSILDVIGWKLGIRKPGNSTVYTSNIKNLTGHRFRGKTHKEAE
jgi:glycosyltransferase involved in cell wall biosynthesis